MKTGDFFIADEPKLLLKSFALPQRLLKIKEIFIAAANLGIGVACREEGKAVPAPKPCETKVNRSHLSLGARDSSRERQAHVSHGVRNAVGAQGVALFSCQRSRRETKSRSPEGDSAFNAPAIRIAVELLVVNKILSK